MAIGYVIAVGAPALHTNSFAGKSRTDTPAARRKGRFSAYTPLDAIDGSDWLLLTVRIVGISAPLSALVGGDWRIRGPIRYSRFAHDIVAIPSDVVCLRV